MAINLFVIVILVSCQSNQENKNQANLDSTKINTQQVYELDELKKWRQDSLGCEHHRTTELFDRIFIANKMEKKNKSEFIACFGKPNAQEKYNDRLVLIYYFNSICSTNNILKNSDKSSIRVSFNFDNKYLEKDTRIE